MCCLLSLVQSYSMTGSRVLVHLLLTFLAGGLALLPLQATAQCSDTRSSGEYTVSWNVVNVDSVSFEVSATTNNWVAVGFSADGFMVCEVSVIIMICMIIG